MTRVLILSRNATGHHPSYVRWLLESDLGAAAEKIVAGPAVLLDHPELQAARASFTPHRVEVTDAFDFDKHVSNPFAVVRLNWESGRFYRQVVREVTAITPIDFVVVPFLDDCLLGLAMPREAFDGIPWMAITMRTMFHYGEMGIVAPARRFEGMRRWFTYRLLRQKSLQRVLTIDPTLADFGRRSAKDFMRKIQYLPDPSTCHSSLPGRLEARDALGVPRDATLVLMFGEISARKGTHLLLAAAADPTCPRRIHVMLAGRFRQREQLTGRADFRRLEAEKRIHLIDDYVTGPVERQVLAAADCMWIGHVGVYGASGVMVLAARHGVPVLATHEGLIGYMAVKHDIGAIIRPDERGSVIEALTRLVEDPEWFRRAGVRGRLAFERHDPSDFQRVVAEIIGSRTLAAPP